VKNNWRHAPLGELASLCLGKMLDKAKNRGTLKPYLRNINVRWGTVELANLQLMAFEEHEVERYSLMKNDVVMCEGGEPGRCAVWKANEKVYIQKALHRIRCGAELDPGFLAYQFQRFASNGDLERRFTGSTIKHLPGNVLSRIEIRYPRLDEQRRIVAEIEKHFTRIDAAVANLERVKANLKRARASVLKAAVEGRLAPIEAVLARAAGRSYEPASLLLERLLAERERKHRDTNGTKKYPPPVAPNTDDLPGLPEGWTWTTVDQLTEFITSGSRGWSEYYAESGARFIRSQDINTYRLNLAGVAHVQLPHKTEGSRTRVYVGDVLVIITGANVTITACVQTDVGEAYVNQHVALCRPVKAVLSPYLHRWMMAEGGGRPQLESAAYGAGKPGLNLTNVRDVRVGLPPLAEQHRIVAEVERRLSVIDALEQVADRNLIRCNRLRQSILKRAFEGKLVLQDPNDEPAEKLLARIQAKTA
jgi:type I restriction enzyme S subunit